jgi:hypothetical protein
MLLRQILLTLVAWTFKTGLNMVECYTVELASPSTYPFPVPPPAAAVTSALKIAMLLVILPSSDGRPCPCQRVKDLRPLILCRHVREVRWECEGLKFGGKIRCENVYIGANLYDIPAEQDQG